MRLREVSLVAVLALASGCASSYQLVPAAAEFSHPSLGLSWITPAEPGEARTLSRWRSGVGPPVVSVASPAVAPVAVEALTIVSWNMALGAGDVGALYRDLRSAHPGHGIILLLQEAFRGGEEVPSSRQGVAFAPRIRRGSPDREIEELARTLGMSLYYVPSMRNGAPGQTDEDRGNAILSTLPLDQLTAIELPFERQRRVAVAARVSGVTAGGTPWQLRVASVHLDNRVGMNKVWIGSEYARTRQARGLRDALEGDEPLVVAGDFNTWFGFADAAFRETQRAFPQTVVTDRRRTFLGLMRLDHVFYRLPSGWGAQVRRAESRMGSDHHPLITTVTVPAPIS
jgi:endonuclease/exonuclease/phosphatase family metal-dependent hydrolase